MSTVAVAAGELPDTAPGRSIEVMRLLVLGGTAWLSRLVAAEAVSYRDCLPLVRFRAQAMQEAVPEGKGAMAAILMLDDEGVRAACVEAGGVVEPVNYNAPGQVVIAGEKAAVERAMDLCKARGAKRALPLPVSAPFHSRLMQPAAARLKGYLENVRIVAPELVGAIPVGDPLPCVAGHVRKTVAVGRETADRTRAERAARLRIDDRKGLRLLALPHVRHLLAVRRELVAPCVGCLVEPAARGEFTFGFGRQALAGPLRVGLGVFV